MKIFNLSKNSSSSVSASLQKDDKIRKKRFYKILKKIEFLTSIENYYDHSYNGKENYLFLNKEEYYGIKKFQELFELSEEVYLGIKELQELNKKVYDGIKELQNIKNNNIKNENISLFSKFVTSFREFFKYKEEFNEEKLKKIYNYVDILAKILSKELIIVYNLSVEIFQEVKEEFSIQIFTKIHYNTNNFLLFKKKYDKLLSSPIFSMFKNSSFNKNCFSNLDEKGFFDILGEIVSNFGEESFYENVKVLLKNWVEEGNSKELSELFSLIEKREFLFFLKDLIEKIPLCKN